MNRPSGVTPCVTGHALYSFYASGGQKVGEATVFASPVAKMTLLLVDQRAGARLGLAIANDTDTAQYVNIGPVFEGRPKSIHSIRLDPRENVAKFLDEIIGYRGEMGAVLINCANGCASIGLRFTGAVFTTIPATVLN